MKTGQAGRTKGNPTYQSEVSISSVKYANGSVIDTFQHTDLSPSSQGLRCLGSFRAVLRSIGVEFLERMVSHFFLQAVSSLQQLTHICGPHRDSSTDLIAVLHDCAKIGAFNGRLAHNGLPVTL